MITNDPEQIKLLKESGRILSQTLSLVASKVAPGVSTIELDKIAENNIRKMGGVPAFKNYRSRKSDPAFPATLCVSINDEVVHGIPTLDKILEDGDIVGIDLGVNYKGMFTDAAITIPVGKITTKYLKLISTAKNCLAEALKQVEPGATTGDIGFAIESEAKKNGFQVVRELVGHGVGLSVHEDPEVPCFGKKGTGTKLQKGMVLAIEPMINELGWEVVFAEDKWTVLTLDGGRSSHFEHTVLVTENGFEILT
jgi:methionyl aminopeptidase